MNGFTPLSHKNYRMDSNDHVVTSSWDMNIIKNLMVEHSSCCSGFPWAVINYNEVASLINKKLIIT